jgi:hypothetical protein
MSKSDLSDLHYTSVLRDAHNEDFNALDIIEVNNLVPARYGKVALTYITSGNGIGEVGQADFYSNAKYESTKVITTADQIGSAHKTTVFFIQRTPSMLAGKAFIIYDNIGGVAVWFNVDGSNTAPVVDDAYRYIQVNILSTDNHEAIAIKTSIAVNADSEFLSVYTSYITVISSVSVGIKPSSKDFNSSLGIKNTAGSEKITLNNKYFFINSALDATEYYVWYNVGGMGVDPAISGKIGIMIPIPTGASVSVINQNTKVILDTTGDFVTNIVDNTLIIKNKLIGVTTASTEGNSGFVVLRTVAGQDRELLVTLILTYNGSNELIEVERL